MAAPTIGSVSSGKTTGSAASLTINHTTVGAAGGARIYVLVGSDDSITCTATFAGVAMTRVAHQDGGSFRPTVFYIDGAAPGAANCVITPSSSSEVTAGVFDVLGYYAADHGLFGWFIENGSGTAVTRTFLAHDNCVCVDILISDVNNQTFTPAVGQTELWSQDGLLNTDTKSGGSRKAGASSVTMAWTFGLSEAGWVWAGAIIQSAPPSFALTGQKRIYSAHTAMGLPVNLGTVFWGPMNGADEPALGATAQVWQQSLWNVSGYLRNIIFNQNPDPPSPGEWTHTLRVNNVPVATLTLTGSQVEARYTGPDIPVLAGSVLQVGSDETGSTPANQAIDWISWEFESGTLGESGYCGSPDSVNGNIRASVGTVYNGLFDQTGNWKTDELAAMTVAPCSGTLVEMAIYQGASVGTLVPTYTVMKNQIAQDGTGGTPNTQIVGNVEWVQQRTFSLAVARGDLIGVRATMTGTGSRSVSVAYRFVADTIGYSVVGCSTAAPPSASLPSRHEYNDPDDLGYLGPSAAESSLPEGGITSFTLRDLTVTLRGAPGGSASLTFAGRKNGVNQALSATVTGAATTATDLVNSYLVEEGDFFGWGVTPAGTPALAGVRLSAVQFVGCIVPTLVGEVEATAIADLLAAGYVIGTLVYAYDDTVPAGTVISQSVAAGGSACGLSIDLVVSLGPVILDQEPPQPEVVPSVWEQDPPATLNATLLRMRRTRRTPVISEEQLRLFFHRLQIDIQTGVGLEGDFSQTGASPQIMLRWSDDNGQTWSNEHWATAGRLGAFKMRALWYRLGNSRNRVFEITVTDPVAWRIVDAFLQISQGNS